MVVKNEQKKEKKSWISPRLVVYGDVEKLTKESPFPITRPPRGGSSSYMP